ncbi:BamA/OMP85 family outer membrane protein [Haliovirga abyssi]|uniref:Outer membrane protein assembly factor n=1 Tax=Haliovirga abyssi TaxID=2996794 RepID=A0AAU9D2T8_9FUSO|nr:BamA/TamA family outer membrane protein [Haliovirga abyssi]BDU50314.1 outer membrane protein assembly factor [Haliovirga abyssi]
MKKLILILNLLILSIAFGDSGTLIKNIEITSNKEVPNEIILNSMKLKKGMEFKSNEMINDYISIKNLEYIKDLEIYPKVEDNGINLMINVVEVEGVKKLLKDKGIVPNSEREKIDKNMIVQSIEVFGNSKVKKKDIIKEIPFTIGSYFSKTKTLEGKNKILAMGYFRDVSPEVLKYKDGIYIKYRVLENPILKGVKIEGNTLIGTKELLSKFNTKIGDIYNINILRKDIDSVTKSYVDKGYFLATVYDVALDNDFNLNIKVSEGILKDIKYEKIIEKTKDNAVSMSKELKTKKYILDREVSLEKGKPMEIAKYKESVKNIFRLGFFKDIKPDFIRDKNDPRYITLVLHLNENRSGSIQGGVSYGNSIGLTGNISVQDNNFMGKSQNLNLKFEVSSKNKKLYELSFYDPWIKGSNHLSFGSGLYRTEVQNSEKSDLDSVYTNKNGIRFSIGKGLTNRIRLSIGTKLEEVTEYNGSHEEIDKYSLLTLYPTIYYDNRDNYLDPKSGEYAKFSTTYGKVFGRTNYYLMDSEFRKYHKFLTDKNHMAYRVLWGYASEETPKSQIYAVGGGNSLRGYTSYDYEGNFELVLNIENRYQIDDNVQGVIFYDVGRTWTLFKDFSGLKDIKMGYGIGLRVKTPLGPLRFDYGWPINDKDKSGGKFYFNIGQLF